MHKLPAFATIVSLLLSSVAFGQTYEAPLDVRAVPAAKLIGPVSVAKSDGKWQIGLELSAASDVEVAIVDKAGRIVRHLAAGLLGKNAPPPLAKDSLKQTVAWDGLADGGKPAGDGPFKVRVRVGSSVGLDKQLGWGGNCLGPVTSVVVGDNGEVYALCRSWVGRGRNEMRVLDRDGKYLRTIMPYSASTPAELTKSVGHLVVDEQRIPVVFSGHGHTLYPLTVGLPRQTMAWSPKGHVVMASTLATPFEHGLPRHLLAIGYKGGAPEGVSFVGPEIRPPTGVTWGHGEGDDPCFDNMAVSPDGKFVYYTQSQSQSSHAVFRLAWDEAKGEGMEDGWFGEVNRPGSGDSRLNDPCGLAVDKAGRVYVCDRGNNRVVVISPDSKLLGQFAIEDPEQIGIHMTTGEIYISCRQAPPGAPSKDIGPMSMAEYKAWKARVAERNSRRPPARRPKLLKLAPWAGDQPKELARLDGGDISVMSLDRNSSPARLWCVMKSALVPITERDNKFEVGRSVDSADGLAHPGHVVADPARNRVLLYQLSSNFKVFSLDIATGAKKVLLDGASDFAIAPDGSIYGTGKFGSNELVRFSADGKPLPFVGSEKAAVKIGGLWIGGVNLGARGITIGPDGDIYLLRANGEKAVQSRLDVYGPDGKLKKAALVDGLGIGDCGVGVDAAGNVYLGVNVKPKNHLFQAGFEKVPGSNWLCWAQWNWHYRPSPWYYSMRNEYLYHWGAVMKFGPEGGAFYGRGNTEYGSNKDAAKVARVENAPPGATDYMTGYLYGQIKAVGAQWRYAGMGIVPSSERQWGDPSCVCMTSRLAVDGFGRVLMPNCFRFCVERLDSNGNLIERVGRYGNADDSDGGPHFAWPAYVSVAGEMMCVSDCVNRRVSVLKVSYADESTADLP